MLVRRIPVGCSPMRLRNGVEQLFEGIMDNAPFGRRAFPALNVWEDDTQLFVEAEVPGLKLDDLELLVEGDELTVKGSRKDLDDEGASFHRRERGTGNFSRIVRLPVEVDADKVQATLRDGILTVTLPKAQAVLPRKIEVTG